MASAHGLGTWCSLLSRKTKIYRALQCALEVLTDRPAVQRQRWRVDRAVLPLVPLNKQLLMQRQQLQADFATDALALGDGDQITDQMHPTQLPLHHRQVVVGREGIADHNAEKAFPSSSIAAAAERLSPCRNTVTTGVTITQKRRYLDGNLSSI